ncbi:hypothetical protein I4F81_007659 [Pyropia yezoensis]|uniref:Uncharacterized protein n=1 Tax=Pyropia yezoensis TaxID=2788 RepID=A0ACC3C4S0_PYRYE|nr:hypothetical protein I4F81_007659 [Neopyropia yezoensis]
MTHRGTGFRARPKAPHIPPQIGLCWYVKAEMLFRLRDPVHIHRGDRLRSGAGIGLHGRLRSPPPPPPLRVPPPPPPQRKRMVMLMLMRMRTRQRRAARPGDPAHSSSPCNLFLHSIMPPRTSSLATPAATSAATAASSCGAAAATAALLSNQAPPAGGDTTAPPPRPGDPSASHATVKVASQPPRRVLGLHGG